MAPKTDDLPGMPSKKVIKAIESAADDYVEKRNARMEAGKLEKPAKTKLIDLMKKHELNEYKFEHEDDEQVIITLKPTEEKLKVKIVGEDEDEGAEEGEE